MFLTQLYNMGMIILNSQNERVLTRPQLPPPVPLFPVPCTRKYSAFPSITVKSGLTSLKAQSFGSLPLDFLPLESSPTQTFISMFEDLFEETNDLNENVTTSWN